MTVPPSVLEALTGIPGFLALVAIVLLVFRSLTIVDAHAKYVVTDDEGVVEVLEPGVHVRSPLERGNQHVDVRTREFESTFEDVGTRDGELADVDVSLTFRVSDVAAAVEETEDYPLPPWAEMSDHDVAILEALEVTLLDAARRRIYDDLAEESETCADACAVELGPALEAVGIDLDEVRIEAVRPSAERAEAADDGAA